jgi:saccharopine dehydrogenase-like NADP-dependent oxidoreductase
MGSTIMVTMVCFINGAANLYFNNGGEYTGASTRYKSVVQAARNLVVNANPLKAAAKRTSQFPLPTDGVHYVYMLTKRGTFKTEINLKNLREESKEKRVVYYLYQQVMSSLRLAQLRDQEAKTEGSKA